MDPTSPTHNGVQAHRSQLLSSISDLRQGIQAAEADADHIETRIAYKEDYIAELRSNRIAHDEPTPAIDKAIQQAQARRENIKEALSEKKDEIARLRKKLEKKEAKLVAIPPVESSNAPSPKDNEDAAALLEVTTTPMNTVFTISEDGKTYTDPAMLRGVPVAPISENDSYWDPMWTKFAEAVNEEKVEREYQEYISTRHQQILDGALSAAEEDPESVFKRYQRNLRQAKVAKQWFRPGHTIHPNQLMAKEHLPVLGLCDNYVLYKICNILSRINAMYERGELGMPPLHFLMWRMSVSLDRHPRNAMKSFWRVIINETHTAYDNILRRAEIRGAQHTGDYNFYLSRRKQVSSTGGQTQMFTPIPDASKTPNAALKRSTMTSYDPDAQQQHRNAHEPTLTFALNQTNTAESRMQMQTFSAQKDGRRKRDRRTKRHSSEAFGQQTSEYDNSQSRSVKKPYQAPAHMEMQLAVRTRPSTESLPSSSPATTTSTKIKSFPILGEKPERGPQAQASVFEDKKAPMEDRLEQDSLKSKADVDASDTKETPPTRDEATAEVQHDNQEWIDMFVGSEEIKRQIRSNPNIEAIRASVGESPFPKNTGRRVSHGFVFPRYYSKEAQKLDELDWL
ncbi:hypothetical protein CORC01_08136 [Colletotrichum orchidophilum]|uniref:Uncharacterized protein n=1 Tax=Colletotrichum orchidophilum TaxID=1209926 RepID=A0A1G4B522_9PEZI|nr:uncharacterized protein CORC01_08136 [Colletotrichum orchidophilum]OHE96538.1 hypothetical protein CORC01_08136 [Colletotrichum orchidophilum]